MPAASTKNAGCWNGRAPTFPDCRLPPEKPRDSGPRRDCAWSHRGALSSDFGPKLWGKSSDKEQETNV